MLHSTSPIKYFAPLSETHLDEEEEFKVSDELCEGKQDIYDTMKLASPNLKILMEESQADEKTYYFAGGNHMMPMANGVHCRR